MATSSHAVPTCIDDSTQCQRFTYSDGIMRPYPYWSFCPVLGTFAKTRDMLSAETSLHLQVESSTACSSQATVWVWTHLHSNVLRMVCIAPNGTCLLLYKLVEFGNAQRILFYFRVKLYNSRGGDIYFIYRERDNVDINLYAWYTHILI